MTTELNRATFADWPNSATTGYRASLWARAAFGCALYEEKQ
jgi:hypothetical protein